MKHPKATLFVHFYEHPIPDGSEADGAYKVTFSVRTDDGKTEAAIPADTPEKYIKNGMLLGIMEELIDGLCRERGISVMEATETAQNRMSGAHQAVQLKQVIAKLELGMVKPEGEC